MNHEKTTVIVIKSNIQETHMADHHIKETDQGYRCLNKVTHPFVYSSGGIDYEPLGIKDRKPSIYEIKYLLEHPEEFVSGYPWYANYKAIKELGLESYL